MHNKLVTVTLSTKSKNYEQTIFKIISVKCDDQTVCEFHSQCVILHGKNIECLCPICNDAFKIVCGSDGKTYASNCWLKKKACEIKENINMVKIGPCCESLLLLLVFVSVSVFLCLTLFFTFVFTAINASFSLVFALPIESSEQTFLKLHNLADAIQKLFRIGLPDVTSWYAYGKTDININNLIRLSFNKLNMLPSLASVLNDVKTSGYLVVFIHESYAGNSSEIQSLKSQLKRLKSIGCSVLVIALGNSNNLENIFDDIFTVPDSNELPGILDVIEKKIASLLFKGRFLNFFKIHYKN